MKNLALITTVFTVMTGLAFAQAYMEKCKFVNGAAQMPSYNNTIPITNAGDVSTSAVPSSPNGGIVGVVINGTADVYTRPSAVGTCSSTIPTGTVGNGTGFMKNENFRWLGSVGVNLSPTTAICVGTKTSASEIYLGYCER